MQLNSFQNKIAVEHKHLVLAVLVVPRICAIDGVAI